MQQTASFKVAKASLARKNQSSTRTGRTTNASPASIGPNTSLVRHALPEIYHFSFQQQETVRQYI
jgi:hypothetical protein